MADSTLSDLADAAPAAAADLVYIVRGGNSRQATLGNYAGDTGALEPGQTEAALGSLAVPWPDAFFASGAVLDFGAGNSKITHSAGKFTLNSASLGIGATPEKLLHVHGTSAFQQYISATNPSTVWGNNIVFGSKTASTTVGVSTGASQFLTGDASGDSVIGSDNDLLFGTGLDPETATGTIRGMIEASTGHWGIGTLGAAPAAQLSLDQASSSGAVPVLSLDQGDIDDTFVNFIGTSAADGTRSISSDTTEDGAKFGAYRVEINGLTKWVRVYDDES